VVEAGVQIATAVHVHEAGRSMDPADNVIAVGHAPALVLS
jgi:hypothetical protein